MELHRFSTKELRWEQLDATRDFVQHLRRFQGMVSVGSQLYVYGSNSKDCCTMCNGADDDCLLSLFRFSTTKQQWEQLDEDISGFPPGKAINFDEPLYRPS
jgi:hypothetical protein